MRDVVYGNKPETILRKTSKASGKESNYVLLGTWLKVLSEQGNWFEVETAGRGPGGWVHKGDVRDTPILKIFFVDVGQGDGAIIESPAGNLLIDGGPTKSFHAFMRYLYGPTIRSGRIFSTELARAVTGKRIHYGLINARSNGETLVMAQMKEQHKKADVWDSYTVPWYGQFPRAD